MPKQPKPTSWLVYGGILLSLILSTLSFVSAQEKGPVTPVEPPKPVLSRSSASTAVKAPGPANVVTENGQKISVTIPVTTPIAFNDDAIVIQPPKSDPDWLKLAPILSGLLGVLIGGGVSLLVAKLAYGNALKLADKQAADRHATDFHRSRIAALSQLIGEIYECQGVALQFDYAQRQLLNLKASKQPIADGQGKLIGTTIKAEVILEAERERDKWNAEFYSATAKAIASAEAYGRVPAEVLPHQPNWGDWILKFRQDLLGKCGEDTIAIAGICNQIALKTRDLRDYEEHLLACKVTKTQPEDFERPESEALGARTLQDRDVSVAEFDRRVAYAPAAAPADSNAT